ncbi:hypothetical protein [Desulfonatronovibrio magnus]|uniref:hypothetical protein n=1 Tax=Desulfonatronovibrio magnus TaxID=698827 RepID=UPI0005EB9318|nr:hypothetical protein [Desulfonatronovibrio magnus]
MRIENFDVQDFDLLKPLLDEKRELSRKEILNKRKAAADEITKAREGKELSLQKIEEDINGKKAEVQEARGKVKNLEFEMAGLQAEKQREQQRMESVIGANQKILIETYDRRIDEAQQYFLEKHDELRKVSISEQVRNEGRNIVNMKSKKVVYSNHASVKAALQYCMDAYRALDGMKMLPDFDPEEIEKIKSEIPDPRELVSHEAETPIAENADWSLWKLFRKIDAVLNT